MVVRRPQREALRARSSGRAGDCWDHTAIDPESRLVVSLVVGKRTAEAAREVVADFRRRTGGRLMRLMTSDEYAPYAEAIRSAYGAGGDAAADGPAGPAARAAHGAAGGADLRDGPQAPRGRARQRVSTRLVFGTACAVALALLASAVSRR